MPLKVIGAGPAGSAAAITALREGCEVRLFEKSALPRHKVCGEFLTPEVAPLLKWLRCWDAFQQAGPAPVRRAKLHFGRRVKKWTLPEPGFGLSRYRLDRLLLDQALGLGAQLIRQPASANGGSTVIAHGQIGRAHV